MPSESNNNTKWRVGNPKSDWSNKRWYPAWLVLWDGFFRCTCWWMACPYLLFHWKQFDRILYCLWDKRKIRGTYLWFYLFWRMDWLCNKLLLNGERFTHETISAKILANANHVDIIVSKSLKKLITVMSTSGDGVYIRQASAINAKSVRVYTNSDSSERNTAFLVLYL